MKGRFAPSPSGRMHLGNVYSALLSWLSAKSQGGEWVLRIEDLDPGRSRKEYAEQIEDDLRWLGLVWDEGGTQGGPDGPYFQSQRNELYAHYLDVLQKKGLTYPCYCTRADIMATQAPHESDGRIVYAGTCRPKNIIGAASGTQDARKEKAAQGCDSSEKGAAHATRIIVPDEEICFIDRHYGEQRVNLATHCGDFILRRKDGAWAYQLAVVVDDALMGITEVVRGEDLLLSAAQQIFLYKELGFKAPEFCHLPLLCNEAGQRLSKRDKSLDMGELRKTLSAAEIIGQLAFYAGLLPHPEPVSAKELITEFDWKKVPTRSITVDKDALS